MGIIKRQGIKNSLVNYVGVFIGAISVLFIYPLMPKEQLGTMQFMLNTAILLAPFAAFGSGLLVIHFFPLFKDEAHQHRGFLFLMTALTVGLALVFIVCLYLFRTAIADLFGTDTPLMPSAERQQFLTTLPYILIATLLVALSNLFQSYSSVFGRIVVPSLFQNVWIKISQPLLVLLFVGGYISFTGVLQGLTGALVVTVVGMVAYIFYLGEAHFRPNFQYISPQLFKQMGTYGAFNLLVGLGGVLSQRVDQLLIAPHIGFEAVAVFSFGFFIGEAIDVPRKALSGIAAPLISEAMKAENFDQVGDIYRKSAFLQLAAGVFLLAGVWSCADALFDLMPKNGDAFRTGKYVILWLGLARIVDMATGTNAEIITYSKYYRFNMVSLLVMAVLNIALNLWLIPIAGIEGSAVATLLSTIVVNVWRMYFIYQKIGILPLSKPMWPLPFLGLLAGIGAAFCPTLPFPLLTLLAKGSIVVIIFIGLAIAFRLIPEISQPVRQFLGKK